MSAGERERFEKENSRALGSPSFSRSSPASALPRNRTATMDTTPWHRWSYGEIGSSPNRIAGQRKPAERDIRISGKVSRPSSPSWIKKTTLDIWKGPTTCFSATAGASPQQRTTRPRTFRSSTTPASQPPSPHASTSTALAMSNWTGCSPIRRSRRTALNLSCC